MFSYMYNNFFIRHETMDYLIKFFDYVIDTQQQKKIKTKQHVTKIKSIAFQPKHHQTWWGKANPKLFA